MSSLQNIKNLFIEGMAYARKKYKSILYDPCHDLCDYQIKLVNQATDINTVMNAIWLGNLNYVWSSSFNAPQPICSGCELAHTQIQFGVGPVEWYFLYGTHGNLCYNLTFFKLEIAPPKVIKKHINDGSLSLENSVMWNVLGGFGTIPSSGQAPVWNSIQSEWISMIYETKSYSTFVLQGSGQNINVTLQSITPMTFDVVLTFKDTAGINHEFNTSMSALTPPLPNVANSCECGYGLGSFYYSYPSMSCVIKADGNTSPNSGFGWIDHQLIKNGIANSLYGQSLQTLSSIINKNVSGGWLWTTIQDNETSIQYMFTHFFAKKFYQDDIMLNNNISASMVNVYKKGVANFNSNDSEIDTSDFSMTMTKTVLSPYTNMNMPASYNIILPGGKKVVLSISTAPNVYPTAFAPYETPALLYDENGHVIGQGLIEANFYFDNNTMVSRLIDFAGGNSKNSSEVNTVMNALNRRQSMFQKFLGLIIVLMPLIVLLGCLLFIFKFRKEKITKTTKTLFVVAVCLLLYFLLF